MLYAIYKITSIRDNLDCRDSIVILNSDQVEATGNKERFKKYIIATADILGRTYREQKARDVSFIIREAVKGMISRTTLRRYILRNLYIYEGNEHPHAGQNPEPMEI